MTWIAQRLQEIGKAGVIGDARGVGQEVMDRDLIPGFRCVGQILLDVVSDRELASFLEDQDCHRGELLGDRAQAEFGVGGAGNVVLEVGHAISAGRRGRWPSLAIRIVPLKWSRSTRAAMYSSTSGGQLRRFRPIGQSGGDRGQETGDQTCAARGRANLMNSTRLTIVSWGRSRRRWSLAFARAIEPAIRRISAVADRTLPPGMDFRRGILVRSPHQDLSRAGRCQIDRRQDGQS